MAEKKSSANKVIVSCAITGSIHTPTMSDALPYRPEDIAAQAIGAAEAGAAILHLHARDPANGRPSGDPALFNRFLPTIKQSTNAVVNITTGGNFMMTIEERIAAAAAFSPEMCSLNMGSMNFALHPMADKYKQWKFDWEEPYLRASDEAIFRNTFRDIKRIAELLGGEHGVKFEHECYDVGHLYNLAYCLDAKWFQPPVFVQMVFGILGGIGAEMRNLMFMKETADHLFGDDYHWSVLGHGTHADAVRDAIGDDGRKSARRARGQPLHRARPVGREQRPAGRQDTPHRRRTGVAGRDARRGEGDMGLKGADRVRF